MPSTTPVVCPDCGRTFKNGAALGGHKRVHNPTHKEPKITISSGKSRLSAFDSYDEDDDNNNNNNNNNNIHNNDVDYDNYNYNYNDGNNNNNNNNNGEYGRDIKVYSKRISNTPSSIIIPINTNTNTNTNTNINTTTATITNATNTNINNTNANTTTTSLRRRRSTTTRSGIGNIDMFGSGIGRGGGGGGGMGSDDEDADDGDDDSDYEPSYDSRLHRRSDDDLRGSIKTMANSNINNTSSTTSTTTTSSKNKKNKAKMRLDDVKENLRKRQREREMQTIRNNGFSSTLLSPNKKRKVLSNSSSSSSSSYSSSFDSTPLLSNNNYDNNNNSNITSQDMSRTSHSKSISTRSGRNVSNISSGTRGRGKSGYKQDHSSFSSTGNNNNDSSPSSSLTVNSISGATIGTDNINVNPYVKKKCVWKDSDLIFPPQTSAQLRKQIQMLIELYHINLQNISKCYAHDIPVKYLQEWIYPNHLKRNDKNANNTNINANSNANTNMTTTTHTTTNTMSHQMSETIAQALQKCLEDFVLIDSKNQNTLSDEMTRSYYIYGKYSNHHYKQYLWDLGLGTCADKKLVHTNINAHANKEEFLVPITIREIIDGKEFSDDILWNPNNNDQMLQEFVNNLSRDYGEPNNKKLKRRLEKAFHYQINQAMSARQNPENSAVSNTNVNNDINSNNNNNTNTNDKSLIPINSKEKIHSQDQIIEVKIRVWDDANSYQLKFEDTFLWNIQTSNDHTCELFSKQLVKELALPEQYEVRIAKIIHEECLKYQLNLQNAPKEEINPIYYDISIHDIRHKLNTSHSKSGSEIYQFTLEGYEPNLFTHSYHHFQT